MIGRRVYLLLVLTLGSLLKVCSVQSTNQDGGFCLPGSSCWPTKEEFNTLQDSLDGKILFPDDSLYANITVMKNTRVTAYPGVIVLVLSTKDVQKCMNFAISHNLKISVQSSGHDYIGRSTSNGSIQINLSRMKQIDVNLNSTQNPAGEITVGSGNSWLRVYREVDKYNRVVVGGSAHTVAMGGYTLGGGHSPMSRKLGFAVDSLLEVEMVTANGSIVVANDDETRVTDVDGHVIVFKNTDLFWALRGGGGGTFGIATKFVFKLHYAPKAMVRLYCSFALYYDRYLIGDKVVKSFNEYQTTSFAPEWGGYLVLSGAPVPGTSYRGYGIIFLNHFGEWGTSSFNTIWPFIEDNKNLMEYNFQNVSTFLEYEVQANDPLYYRSYIANVIMQKDSFTEDFYNFIIPSIMEYPFQDSTWGCTGALIGAQTNVPLPNSTAVSPAFRSGLMSLSCGLAWGGNGAKDNEHVEAAVEFTKSFLRFGEGTYFNEPSAYLPDWKTAYWGGHYEKLLDVKVAWDPNNVFSCFHCVGSDLNTTNDSLGDETTTDDTFGDQTTTDDTLSGQTTTDDTLSGKTTTNDALGDQSTAGTSIGSMTTRKSPDESGETSGTQGRHFSKLYVWFSCLLVFTRNCAWA